MVWYCGLGLLASIGFVDFVVLLILGCDFLFGMSVIVLWWVAYFVASGCC